MILSHHAARGDPMQLTCLTSIRWSSLHRFLLFVSSSTFRMYALALSRFLCSAPS